MSDESEAIATLSSSVSALTSAVSVKKASLDASEAAAVAAASTATTKAGEAVTDANTASTKAGEASSSAASAAISEGNAAAIALGNFPDAVWSAMHEAEFNKLAEAVRNTTDRSGFVEFGDTHQTVASYPPVNYGLWTIPIVPNELRLGEESYPSGNTNSKTDYPIVAINGTNHKLRLINNATQNNTINFPPAPTVFPSGTWVSGAATDQDEHLIVEGICIQHADATNSGLISGGDFTQADGALVSPYSAWSPASFATLSVDTNRLKVVSDAGYTYGVASQGTPTVIGETYSYEIKVTLGTSASWAFWAGTTNVGGDVYSSGTKTVGGNYKVEFTATTTTTYINLVSIDDGAHTFFDNISVIPKKCVERTDLSFIESWHELVSDKAFLYPLGNVRYQGADLDGLSVATVSTTGAPVASYSAFGNWEYAPVQGKGITMAEMTANPADLATFVANPDNNCYYNDTGALVQVRYRVRTIAGTGDVWDELAIHAENATKNFGTMGNGYFLAARGSQTSIANEIIGSSSIGATFRAYDASYPLLDRTIFRTQWASSYGDGISVSALPIATVKRLNRGAYHPLFNSRGTSTWNSTVASGVSDWYKSDVNQPSSTNDALSKALHTSTTEIGYYIAHGYIGSYLGRPDARAYDAIYADQVTDLRLSTKKDYTASNTMQHLISGSARGQQLDPSTWSAVEAIADGTGTSMTVRDSSFIKIGDVIQFAHNTTVFCREYVASITDGTTIVLSNAFVRTQNATTIYSVFS